MQLSSKSQLNIVLARATEEDLLESPPDLITIAIKELEKYHFLAEPFGPTPQMILQAFPENPSANDLRDIKILHLLQSGVADYLVSEDRKLVNRSRKVGLIAYRLREAIDIIRSTLGEPIEWLNISEVEPHRINLSSEVFQKLKTDYVHFEEWWAKSVVAQPRPVFVLGNPEDPEGIAVLKDETREKDKFLHGNVLKICTFYVQDKFEGSKRGERLLFFTLNEARKRNFQYVYMTTSSTNIKLINWAQNFGFEIYEGKTNELNEVFLIKQLRPFDNNTLPPLKHNIAYGPGSLAIERARVVPIKMNYALRLFPEAMGIPNQFALPGFDTRHPSGNAIRKVYICNSQMRDLVEGDLLLFVATGFGEGNRLIALGVLEALCITGSSEELYEFSQSRTIFENAELESWCSHKEALAIKFRLDRVVMPAIPISQLQSHHVLTSTPQSITSVNDSGLQWVKSQFLN